MNKISKLKVKSRNVGKGVCIGAESLDRVARKGYAEKGTSE